MNNTYFSEPWRPFAPLREIIESSVQGSRFKVQGLGQGLEL
jgi:hypothetical protein